MVHLAGCGRPDRACLPFAVPPFAVPPGPLVVGRKSLGWNAQNRFARDGEREEVFQVGWPIRVVQQYEDGIIFRFGKVLPGVRGPGMTFLRPIGDRLLKVNKQIVAMAVPAQEGITRDNVSVRVDAVVYFRVVDPIKASINVFNYRDAISQRAQTSLRSIIGQSEMDELLAERDMVNRRLCQIIDEGTEMPWGVKVESVEIKDVSLPEGMKRSMSRQAEAERERRARIITADGEFQASKRLAAAANVMARDPAALQLRLLQTVVEVAAERNSTLVMPVPVELLRFFDRYSGTPSAGDAGEHGAEEQEPAGELGEIEAAAAQATAEIDKATADVPLEIPDVPAIPELSAAEKGDVGTVHRGIHAADPQANGEAEGVPSPQPSAEQPSVGQEAEEESTRPD
jgi:regulator of protease activity HflC (stomatin/prohibitin superfamily)